MFNSLCNDGMQHEFVVILGLGKGVAGTVLLNFIRSWVAMGLGFTVAFGWTFVAPLLLLHSLGAPHSISSLPGMTGSSPSFHSCLHIVPWPECVLTTEHGTMRLINIHPRIIWRVSLTRRRPYVTTSPGCSAPTSMLQTLDNESKRCSRVPVLSHMY